MWVPVAPLRWESLRMACVTAAHATWIPKEAEAATASFSLQPRLRLDGSFAGHAHRVELLRVAGALAVVGALEGRRWTDS